MKSDQLRNRGYRMLALFAAILLLALAALPIQNASRTAGKEDAIVILESGEGAGDTHYQVINGITEMSVETFSGPGTSNR